ncbi:ROK family protein [Roseimaritima ulvae]|uniref:N-acetylmannosamine kinase n=1 Tax=Roseimaritima ulvae TaxID=980254 RepID=A0A5B9R319_9BACT|nr:ROK family protein [Roseimaritima ulvae]QEG40723.1 N-acetylmannosamine kinase [Roseimaritima ulvae]
MHYFIGVDVGGTTSTIAVGSEQRDVLYVSDQFETRSAAGPAATVQDIVDQILNFLQHQGHDLRDVASVALATPGPATRDGVLLKTPNLDPRLWNRCPIRKMLETALGQNLRNRASPPDSDAPSGPIAVRYIGDGQAAAFGEYAIRKRLLQWPEIWSNPHADTRPHFDPQTLDSLFLIAVGTGLGGGEVQNGRVAIGREGRAGHAGHMFLPYDAFRYAPDREFRVGNAVSTVESAVSLTALTHQLEHRLSLPEWSDHPLRSAPGTFKDRAKQLRELAAQGDPLASELFDDQARATGIALLQINYLGDFDLLVIGGGVCDLATDTRRRYLQIAQAAYLEHALDGFRNLEGFAFSICGDQASVIGALAHSYGPGLGAPSATATVATNT